MDMDPLSVLIPTDIVDGSHFLPRGILPPSVPTGEVNRGLLLPGASAGEVDRGFLLPGASAGEVDRGLLPPGLIFPIEPNASSSLPGDLAYKSPEIASTLDSLSTPNIAIRISPDVSTSVLARPIPKGTVPFGAANMPFGAGPKPKCALWCFCSHLNYFWSFNTT